MFLLILSLLGLSSPHANASDLFNYDQAVQVMEYHGQNLHSIPGVSSTGITECIAGRPRDTYSSVVPDLVPEACIQVTFTSESSMNRAREQYGVSFLIDSVIIFLGGVQTVDIQPGLTVHN